MTPLLVRPMAVEDEAECLAANQELTSEGFGFLLDLREDEPWAAYVHRVLSWAEGDGLPDGWVPATFLLGVCGDRVVGRVLLRHELTPFLTEIGGHVGYAVRRLDRRRGYATRLLETALDRARALGLDEVLLTCDEDNAASAAVIERAGGRYVGLSAPWEGQQTKRRYWIDL